MGMRQPPIGQSVCVYVFVCVGMTALALAPYLSPVAHTESNFNTPTCLGRGSDTALFSYNGGQTVGAGGRRRRGFIGQKEERALMIRLLSPAVSRRRVLVKSKEDRGKKKNRKKDRIWQRRGGTSSALFGGLKKASMEQQRDYESLRCQLYMIFGSVCDNAKNEITGNAKNSINLPS